MLVPSAPAEEKFSAAGADGRFFSCRFPDPAMIVSLGDQRLVGCIGCLIGPGGGLDHRLDCDGAGRHLPYDDSGAVPPDCKQWRGILIS